MIPKGAYYRLSQYRQRKLGRDPRVGAASRAKPRVARRCGFAGRQAAHRFLPGEQDRTADRGYSIFRGLGPDKFDLQVRLIQRRPLRDQCRSFFEGLYGRKAKKFSRGKRRPNSGVASNKRFTWSGGVVSIFIAPNPSGAMVSVLEARHSLIAG